MDNTNMSLETQKKKKEKKVWIISAIIFVTLVLVFFFYHYGTFDNDKEKKQIEEIPDYSTLAGEVKANYVCKNLDDGGKVFSAIMERRAEVEDSLGMKMKMIYGNETEARMWAKDGVMCDIGADVCHPDYLFCMHIVMVVPVNYTEWEDWHFNGIQKGIAPKEIIVVPDINITALNNSINDAINTSEQALKNLNDSINKGLEEVRNASLQNN